ncbi:hypothetical protein AB1Y20_011464 [Prymnesium parvum]|uniref:Fe2OG dioxygenase domain-containing protein n=1 Tax=Prymnesium parvum TaxID=97485 RepID=A0AB34IQ63_PRYPA
MNCVLLAAVAARAGSWTARATLDADTVVDGVMRASASGQLEFVPRSGYGRGVGEWVDRSGEDEGQLFEGKLQLFLYEAREAPDAPTELLLLGVRSPSGELHCCVFAAEGEKLQRGMLVGLLLASPHSSRSLKLRQVRAHAAFPPFEFDEHPPLPPLSWEEHRVGKLESVFYIPEFLTPREEKAIDEQIRASPPELWRQMAGRRVQECGSCMAPSGAGLLLEELPPWMQRVCERLILLGVFPPSMPPNSVALNEYAATEGIAAHADGPVYAPRVAVISLFSPAVFRFYGSQPELEERIEWDPETDTPAHRVEGPPVESLLLRPRSLLLFCGTAFREHCHEVAAVPDGSEVLGDAAPLVNGHLAGACEGERIVRSRRVSLTVRHLLEFLLAPEAYTDSASR